MESHNSLRTDEPNAGYRYQYEYEQASYMEIYSHTTGQALAPAAVQPVPDWRLHPLSLTIGSEIARQFQWKAETGTVYTYEHELTYRYIHLDRITRQFCDQQRNPLSADRALAHAMPRPDEMFQRAPEVHEAQTAQPLPLPAPSFAGPAASFPGAAQPFSGQSLVGQWKAASEVRERTELSVGSFVRRADMEAQENHERFTASAVRFLQHELPPGTGALVRIYRKLTMKASQVHHAEPQTRQAQMPEAQISQIQSQTVQAAHMQAPQAQAAQLYAESAPLPPQPVIDCHEAIDRHEPMGRRELNVSAFTRRAA